jgi:hypothetical protein
VAALGLLGFVVQVGGVAIYFGSQMREAGDYPYQRALSDPRFMSESHWNPNYTPIAGHWRMLVRNLREHAAGRYPRLSLAASGGPEASRIGVPEAQAATLTHGFDVWPAYAVYAGMPVLLVLVVWGVLWLVAWAYFTWAWGLAGAMSLAPRAARPAEMAKDENAETGAESERPTWSMTERR